MEILSEQNKLELSDTLQDDWHAMAGERRHITTGDLKKVPVLQMALGILTKSYWHKS